MEEAAGLRMEGESLPSCRETFPDPAGEAAAWDQGGGAGG